MFEISVMIDFSAAHNLRNYQGKCENLHGHNWQVEAVFGSEKLHKHEMVMDFNLARKILKDTLKSLDHSYINKNSYFKKVNPTSENIAEFIFKALEKKVRKHKCRMVRVNIWETARSRATYYE